MRAKLAIGLAAALLFAAPVAADAQEAPAEMRDPVAVREPVALSPTEETRARTLEGELRCPVCRSQSIRQSRSFMAEDMKRRVRELVAAGRTDKEIRDHFVARYGEWILLTPPRGGFNLAAWLPVFAVAAGAIGLALAARRWSRTGAGRAVVEPPVASRHLARLEREIEETK
ncbi:hypothetical protein BH18GEM1_BH18GEM1_13670 [soil metagenome]